MADDRVRKLAEDAINRLAAELEAGKSEALQNYLNTMGRFYNYSWGNVLLIGSQRPTATHVAGYHKWKDLGRQVKTGEKGIMILAPIKVRQRQNTPPLPNPDHTAAKKDDALEPLDSVPLSSSMLSKPKVSRCLSSQRPPVIPRTI